MRLFALPDPVVADSHSDGMTTSHRGAVSEYLAIAKLLELGHRVAVPVVDDAGVDLIVDYRTTVQVKMRTEATEPGGNSFPFPLGRGRYRRDGEYVRGLKGGGNQADILLCHAVAPDAWWVIPWAWLFESGWTTDTLGFGLTLEPTRASKYGALSQRTREAWHLFGEDWS